MSWAKFDDRTPSNPKVALLRDAAFRLWFSAICHACEHLTDGYIDSEVPQLLPRAPNGRKLSDAIRELVKRGLWAEVDGGWEIHDFLDWNPPATEIKEKRALARQRMERVRANKQRTNGEVRAKFAKCSPYPVPVPVPVPEITNQAAAAVLKTDPHERASAHQAAAAAREPVAIEQNRPATARPDAPTGTEAQTTENAPTSQLDASTAVLVKRPSNLAEALLLHVSKRAQALTKEPHIAGWLEPHKWPEVQALADEIAIRIGLPSPVRLGPYERDRGTRQMVELYSIFTSAELERAVEACEGDPWFSTKRGLSDMSIEVVRRLLDPRRARPRGQTRQPGYSGERSFSAVEAMAGTPQPGEA